MSEQAERHTQEHYTSFVTTHIEKTLNRPEFHPFRDWYKERLNLLQPLEITEAAVTDGRNWQVEFAQNSNDSDKKEVKRVFSKFFEFVGRKITKKNPDGSVLLEWNQPGIIQTEIPVTLPTPDGAMVVKASGFIGIILDQDNNVLLTLDQEPFATTPKQALMRTVAQTSATKLEGILQGREELDPKLADLLKKLGGGKKFSDLFAQGDVTIFPLVPADANRIQATNFGFFIRVNEPKLREELTGSSLNRWCSLGETHALIETALLNGHTTAAYLGAMEIMQRNNKLVDSI